MRQIKRLQLLRGVISNVEYFAFLDSDVFLPQILYMYIYDLLSRIGSLDKIWGILNAVRPVLHIL